MQVSRGTYHSEAVRASIWQGTEPSVVSWAIFGITLVLQVPSKTSQLQQLQPHPCVNPDRRRRRIFPSIWHGVKKVFHPMCVHSKCSGYIGDFWWSAGFAQFQHIPLLWCQLPHVLTYSCPLAVFGIPLARVPCAGCEVAGSWHL